MKLKADPLLPTVPGTPWWWGFPKGEARRVDSKMGREADASAAVFFIRVISQGEGTLRVTFSYTSCLLFAPLEEQKELKRQRIKEEHIGILRNWERAQK